MREKYIIITWPESQDLMDVEGFNDNCYLITDDEGLEKFGSFAFFVKESWYNDHFHK